ncbi:MAG: ribbon-helix-helix protein, CopG family [Ardenticatenaceae bacterium]|nr:ribbon-helix-helix protein, CopG family [Ardenticatenaceae bacterium]
MKTVQMTIDEVLLTQVDTLVEALGTNRSAFMREALESALKQRQVKVLEEQHRAGYERQPLTPDEFDIWQEEQVWGSTP